MSGNVGGVGAVSCAYPACNKTFVRRGDQGAVPKKFCSASCRSRDHQRRTNEAVNHPEDAMRRAVEQALRPLNTEQAKDALRAMPQDVRSNFERVREVLAEIHKHIPDSND